MRSKLLERIEVVYEDLDVIVIEKGSGVITYPVEGDRKGSAIQLIRKYWRVRGRENDHLYLLHRLDKETSGLLVFAKTSLARESLRKQFERHAVVREYMAVTSGIPPKSKGVIQTFLGRNARGKRGVSQIGKKAQTNFEVLQTNVRWNHSLIRCRLLTGRTHQARIHLAHLGTPIVGDHVYGKGTAPDLALHACTLGFLHPRTGQPLLFTTSLPPRLQRLME